MGKRKVPKKRPEGAQQKFTREEVLSWEQDYYSHCKEGGSLKEFLGMKGLGRDYFHERKLRDIPELYDIMERGKAYQDNFYRRLLLSAGTGKIKSSNSACLIWLSKAMCGWRDPNFIQNEIDIEPQNDGRTIFKARFGNGSREE
jgi:hypothetical protein